MTPNSMPPPNDPDPDHIRAVQERMCHLRVPEWPVFGLVDMDDQAWLCGAGEDDGRVRALRIDYRPPGDRERLIVQTQPARTGEPQLDVVLDQAEREEDEGEPLRLLADPDQACGSSTESRTEALVNRQTVPATQQLRGTTAAWRLQTRGVTVIVAVRNFSLEPVALHQIDDFQRLKQRRTDVIDQFLRARPYPPQPYRPQQ